MRHEQCWDDVRAPAAENCTTAIDFVSSQTATGAASYSKLNWGNFICGALSESGNGWATSLVESATVEEERCLESRVATTNWTCSVRRSITRFGNNIIGFAGHCRLPTTRNRMSCKSRGILLSSGACSMAETNSLVLDRRNLNDDRFRDISSPFLYSIVFWMGYFLGIFMEGLPDKRVISEEDAP
ncbi:hypothetical protein EVAR_81068_1 [Eumeta japonica]|uniref:Uncharacterized protein n=1 Tax=Eumeta variegata TaxID=151549 RepID=A0A4C1T8B7_EUMVA|nr:hypothetical protein EVAR_81068_1 [Eumeta japonica]